MTKDIFRTNIYLDTNDYQKMKDRFVEKDTSLSQWVRNKMREELNNSDNK